MSISDILLSLKPLLSEETLSSLSSLGIPRESDCYIPEGDFDHKLPFYRRSYLYCVIYTISNTTENCSTFDFKNDQSYMYTIGVMSNFKERLQPIYHLKKEGEDNEGNLHRFIYGKIRRDILNSLPTPNSILESEISIKFDDEKPLLASSCTYACSNS